MSHSTVFPLSQELIDTFSAEVSASAPKHSFLRIRILNEQLALTSTGAYKSDISEVFREIAATTTEPSFVPLRLSETGKWLLLMYIPDDCAIKDRMLYAASRDTLKRQLGYNNFMGEYICREMSQINYEEYLASTAKVDAMTEVEKLKILDNQLERDSHIDAKSKSRLAFPISAEGASALEAFKNGQVSFVQLRVDTGAETLELVHQGAVDLHSIAGHFTSDGARFVLFRFRHQHPSDNSQQDKTVFYLSCPDSVKPKERMLSASVKSSLVTEIEGLGITIHKQFDTDNEREDVTETALLSYLYKATAQAGDAPVVVEKARPAQASKGPRGLIGKRRKELADDDDE